MKFDQVTKDKIDELVMFSEFDPELKEGLAWLDKTNKYPKEMDFYERVINCLSIHDVNERAKDWRLQQILDSSRSSK